MSRGSVATLLALAVSGAGFALHPGNANALSPGYGKGPGYCYAYGNRPSRYSFDGVYACATTASHGATPFDSARHQSFQCVEFSARFLWAVYGIWAGPSIGVPDGAELVAVIHRLHPQIRVATPGPGSVPVAGDVISLGPGDAVDPRFGHTAVVVAANQRTGFFTIIAENFPPGYAGEQTLRVGLNGRHDGRVLIDRAWTTASWLVLRQPPRSKSLRP